MTRRKNQSIEEYNTYSRFRYYERKKNNPRCIVCSKTLGYRNTSQYCKRCYDRNPDFCVFPKLKRTSIWKANIAKAKIGSKNPSWKGSKVGYSSLHQWVKRHKHKPVVCEHCKIKPPIDLANISQRYYRDILDFEWLCRKCHMVKDGRLNKLTKHASKK